MNDDLRLFCKNNNLFLTGVYILRLETFERGNWDVGDKGVQFVSRVLVVVSPSAQSNAHTEWDVSEANQNYFLLLNLFKR